MKKLFAVLALVIGVTGVIHASYISNVQKDIVDDVVLSSDLIEKKETVNLEDYGVPKGSKVLAIYSSDLAEQKKEYDFWFTFYIYPENSEVNKLRRFPASAVLLNKEDAIRECQENNEYRKNIGMKKECVIWHDKKIYRVKLVAQCKCPKLEKYYDLEEVFP